MSEENPESAKPGPTADSQRLTVNGGRIGVRFEKLNYFEARVSRKTGISGGEATRMGGPQVPTPQVI